MVLYKITGISESILSFCLDKTTKPEKSSGLAVTIVCMASKLVV